MNKVVVVLSIFVITVLTLSAGNEKVVGEWDCEAYVDMSYPFTLNFTEEGGKLNGTITGDAGITPLESISYTEGKLKFQFDYPPGGGLIDFEANVEEKSIEGTLGNDMFMGDFSCTAKK